MYEETVAYQNREIEKIGMNDKLKMHLDNGDYFLAQRMGELEDILNYLAKHGVSATEIKQHAKRGVHWLKPCRKWAKELRDFKNEFSNKAKTGT